MPRYIDAEKIVFKYEFGMCSDENIVCVPMRDVKKSIDNTPTADVVEVKHGYWKQNPYFKSIYYCSVCDRHIEDGSHNPNEHFPYCHCGAKMDGERKTENVCDHKG